MQFSDKQAFQTLNIPAYGQNNTVLSVQTHNLPMRIGQNVYVSQIDGNHFEKNDSISLKSESEEENGSTVSCNLSLNDSNI